MEEEIIFKNLRFDMSKAPICVAIANAIKGVTIAIIGHSKLRKVSRKARLYAFVCTCRVHPGLGGKKCLTSILVTRVLPVNNESMMY